MTIKNEKHALMFGLAAVLLWSTVASAFKLTLQQFTPPQMLFAASLVSIIVLTLVCFYQGNLNKLYPTLKKKPLYYLILGLINPFLYYLILFKAYDLLPASQAQPLNYSWAITLTLLAAFFLKQKIRLQDGIACLLGYVGVLIIATKGQLLTLNFDNPLGVGLALLSTVLWASYWILNTKNTEDPIIVILLGFLLSLPFSASVVIYQDVAWNAIDIYGWLAVSYVGLFEMGITFVLWLSALHKTNHTSRISNLIFLSPFISLYLLHYIIGEEIYISTVIGLCFILFGLAIQQIKNKNTVN